MKVNNEARVEFPGLSANEAFARSIAACFAAQLDPTLEELGDLKTAVSEAVTNCIVMPIRRRRAGYPFACASWRETFWRSGSGTGA